jgi:hypothetical protein
LRLFLRAREELRQLSPIFDRALALDINHHLTVANEQYTSYYNGHQILLLYKAAEAKDDYFSACRKIWPDLVLFFFHPPQINCNELGIVAPFYCKFNR